VLPDIFLAFLLSLADFVRRRVRGLVAEATHPVRWVMIAAEPITDVDTTAPTPSPSSCRSCASSM
jgi:hypothetical protein